jgi:glyoxylase-like metal-dependent hydrolase (beta-lactamase superfamily II)
MGAYMASLEKLRRREDRVYYPAHGPAVDNPQQYLRQLVGHRMQRESQILSLIRERPRRIAEIVVDAYPGLDPRLTIAAGGSVLAHLLDLRQRGLVERQQDTWTAA